MTGRMFTSLCAFLCVFGLMECVRLGKTPPQVGIRTETSEKRLPSPPELGVGKRDDDSDNGLGNVSVNTTVIQASFGTNYTQSVKAADLLIFAFSYNMSTAAGATVVRMHIESEEANASFPLLVVVRQQEGILSWQIPLLLDHVYEFSRVSRTLCPILDDGRRQLTPTQRIYVDISSMLPAGTPPIQFSLRLQHDPHFQIQEDEPKTVTITPSQPQYYLYQFANETQSVMLTVTSPDTACMTLSIQQVTCPVFDLDTNVAFEGKYMTMTKQGSLFLERREFPLGEFYVVFIMKPSNIACAGIETVRPPGQLHLKSVTITAKRAISKSQYLEGILTAAGILLGIIIIVILFVGLSKGCGYYKRLQTLVSMHTGEFDCSVEELGWTPSSRNSFSSDDGSAPLLSSSGSNYGTTNNAIPGSVRQLEQTAHHGDNDGDNSSVSSLDTSDIDFLHDANEEKEIYRTKVALVVSDLARKKGKKLDKIYKIYHWNLLTIAIFYGLPVIQLVITYQLVLQDSGNQDLCYYNFECAHPLGPISAFNNVYSNIGYAVLGILFIIIVYVRDKLHRRFCTQYNHLDSKYGLPQHFGLFYAMGLALMMEGVMSACYHVCPNYSNFQFDTSFMYIIACLCILKIYQNRHPDVNAKAHATYLFMSIVILIAVLGVVYGNWALWIAYGVIHMLTALVLSANIYYMSRWRIDRHIFKRIFFKIRTDGIRCAKPAYLDRFILLFVGNIINWTAALYGAITQPSDFATYLLAVFIGNLLLYVLFYIIMKLRCGERIPNLAVACILCSTFIWGFALYFFLSHLTSWKKTPAMSRELNQPCVLLEFYDTHDVWHFLSAISLFLSFMILLTLDDDLITVERRKIPVF